MAISYQVGQPFPDTRYNTGAEGGTVRFNESSFDVLIVLRGLSNEELNAFKSGNLRYGLFCKNSIPFLVVDVDSQFNFEASFNIRKLEAAKLQPWLQSGAGLITFVLIEQRGFTIAALKAVSLPSDISKKLTTSLTEQLATYQTKDEVDRQITRIMNQYSTEQMFKEVARTSAPAENAASENPTIEKNDIIDRLYKGAPYVLRDKQYPSPIPDDIKHLYCYITDSGHSILALVEGEDYESEPDLIELLVPCPVKTVLRTTKRYKGFPVVACPYDDVLGLQPPDEDVEY